MAKTAKNKKYGDPRKRAAHEGQAPRAMPVQEPHEPLSPTPAGSWATNSGPVIADVRLPSGNVARVRHVGPEAFLGSGVMPDRLTPIIDKAIHSKKGLRPKDTRELTTDPSQLGAMLEMLDRMLCYAVVEPQVSMPPACTVCGALDTTAAKQHDISDPTGHRFAPGPRRQNTLYADVVDLEDKVFIMNYAVGGTGDLERFRQQLGTSVGSVSSGQGSQG